MRTLYLDWDRAPCVLLQNSKGHLLAAFVKSDVFEPWKSTNPLQVFVEGVNLSRKDFLVRFEGRGLLPFPKLKEYDLNKGNAYLEPIDPWSYPDIDAGKEAKKKIKVTAEDLEIITKGVSKKPRAERFGYTEKGLDFDWVEG